MKEGITWLSHCKICHLCDSVALWGNRSRRFQRITKMDVSRASIGSVFLTQQAHENLKKDQHSGKDRLLRVHIIFILTIISFPFSSYAKRDTLACQLYPDDIACNCPTNIIPKEILPPDPPKFGSGTPFIQTTFRSGNGMPELAITPTRESGAIVFNINTPSSGTIPLLIQPAGPDVSLTSAPIPEPRPFRPPSIFSAPLPVGSGARALGFAGAFTSIADDATAASWNPAGLIQLERPEVSAVYRGSRVENRHTSDSDGFLVGEDDYDSYGLNYLSASIPFRLESLQRNIVFSANFQEAYDFESSFSARFRDRGQERITQSSDRVFAAQQIDQFIFAPDAALRTEVEIVSDIETRSSSRLEQRIDTDVTADLRFKQEGIIDGFSLAAATELNARFALGIAINLYQDSTLEGGGIRSKTRSTFTATSKNTSHVTNRRATSGSFTATETSIFGDEVLGVDQTEGTLDEVVDEQVSQSSDVRIVEGEFVEDNRFDDVHGFNATLGAWWVATDFLMIGASVDLPWSADSEQTRTVRATSTTFNSSKSRILGTSEEAEIEQKEVEFNFPFFATLGALVLWSPNLYTSMDVRFVDWSSFAYDVEGEGKINPFDGTPHGQHAIKDTWSARIGTEYLHQWAHRKIEIPLRVGLVWEQRPALGDPDDYYGFSCGSGIGLGENPGKLFVDFAYNYLRADDVQTVVPEQDGLSTDTVQHQFFVSVIKHF